MNRDTFFTTLRTERQQIAYCEQHSAMITWLADRTKDDSPEFWFWMDVYEGLEMLVR